MDKKLLAEIALQQNRELLDKEDSVEREQLGDIDRYLKIPHSIVIAGVRRSGKSTFLAQIINRKFKEGVYYLNFEDERLITFDASTDFDSLYQVFIELFGEKKTFFFDEIQNISNWERFVRRMYDRRFKFFITGSNARLLSKELATHLTGRHILVEMYPFSFGEFLRFNKVLPAKNFEYYTEERAKLIRLFRDYVEGGGFPEYLKYKEKETLRRLYSDIIFRDIIVRYGIRETKAFQEITNYFAANIANTISFNKLKNMFNLGSANTVKNFTEYLESSFLMFFVSAFSYSRKKQLAAPKKVYCIDTGLRNAVSFRFSEDAGRHAENTVFIELKRRGGEIYYWKNEKGRETDFVIKEGLNVQKAIQVCWKLNGENKKREINGLLAAMEEFKLKNGTVITEDFEATENLGKKEIIYTPLWKWLLKQ